MTTLPERLRASAQVLRRLPACSEHSYEVLDVVAWNLARELEEAAQALEGADGVATAVFRCAREGACDVTPRCTAQCGACAAAGAVEPKSTDGGKQ